MPKRSSGLEVHKMFLDPTGSHLLISTKPGENFYLYKGWKKPKALPRS